MNSKSYIPSLVKDLQKRLKKKDRKYTQGYIASKIYDSPRDVANYRKRFIQRTITTQYNPDEITSFIELFSAVMRPSEAISLVAWSQVAETFEIENDLLEGLRKYFDYADYLTAKKDYQLQLKQTNTSNSMLSQKDIESSPNEKIPLYRVSSIYNNEIDLGRLVGIDPFVQSIVDALLEEQGSRYISLEGPGGIGKTSVAEYAVAKIRHGDDFNGVIWISVGRYLFLGDLKTLNADYNPVLDQIGRVVKIRSKQAVKNLLESEPYLIVIDNIETEKEATESVDDLLSLSHGRSRFLFTSRYSLEKKYPIIKSQLVDEMDKADVKYLLEIYLEKEKLSPEEISRVYNIVGGIPLALILMCRLARTRGLNRTLSEIENLQSSVDLELNNKATVTFEYIYGTIWKEGYLSTDSKKLLVQLSTRIPEDGFSADMILSATTVANDKVFSCLENIFDYHLLTRASTEKGDLLFIHALTRTYIHSVLGFGS
ncbi:MAG: NB-ARC domain-containing protein [Phototrophicaceae bacterium]